MHVETSKGVLIRKPDGMRRKRTYKEAQALMHGCKSSILDDGLMLDRQSIVSGWNFSCPPVSKDSQKVTMNKWASYRTHASIDAWLARAAYHHRGVSGHQASGLICHAHHSALSSLLLHPECSFSIMTARGILCMHRIYPL